MTYFDLHKNAAGWYNSKACLNVGGEDVLSIHNN